MPDLSEIRLRLDQMTERILGRLKDRSRFPQNPAVYLPDGVALAGRDGISFLEYALEGLEAFHATLGRYEYPDQYPLFTAAPPASMARRIVGAPDIPRLAISIREDLLRTARQIDASEFRRSEEPDRAAVGRPERQVAFRGGELARGASGEILHPHSRTVGQHERKRAAIR